MQNDWEVQERKWWQHVVNKLAKDRKIDWIKLGDGKKCPKSDDDFKIVEKAIMDGTFSVKIKIL